MSSSWGTTETAPLATAAHYLLDRAGNVGLPVPGVEMKLVPSGDKLEIRVRGPNITPGYWKRPDLTAAAFDAEGFYVPGDAVCLADPADAAQGVLFDGRLAEDFKLTTGTWVHVGALRVGVLAACSPVLQDAIVAGADREFVALLCWLNAAGCQKLIGEGAPSALPELAEHPMVREHVRALAAGLERRASGIVGARRARDAVARRALDRRQRDHRQGLHQPAPRAGAARRRGGAPVRRAAGSGRDRRFDQLAA